MIYMNVHFNYERKSIPRNSKFLSCNYRRKFGEIPSKQKKKKLTIDGLFKIRADTRQGGWVAG